MLFGNFFGDAIKVLPQHNVLAQIHFDGIGPFIAHGLQSAPFILAVLGFGLAWLLYLREPHLPDMIRDRVKPIYNLLVRKYGFDEFNQKVFAGVPSSGGVLWRIGRCEDHRWTGGERYGTHDRLLSSIVRHVQSGYIYHYAFAMIIGCSCS